MNNEARSKLIEIVQQYGEGVLQEPKKIEALLNDLCGNNHRKEIFGIVNALKEGVADDLIASSKANTEEITIARLSSRIRDSLGISEEVSSWSVATVAAALGVISEKEATAVSTKQASGREYGGFFSSRFSELIEIKTSNGDELIYVEGGSFIMGDTWGDGYGHEKPTHKVTFTYDFHVGKYPVIFEEYGRFCKETGVTLPSDGGWGRGRKSIPVVNVSWFDSMEYCNWLSEKEGLPIAYYGDGSLLDENRRKTEDITRVKGYRLLTEAEWEYVAKGGNRSLGYKYAGSNNPDSVAWFARNSGDSYIDFPEELDSKEQNRVLLENKCGLHKVGKKKSNELGLHDMSGNTWEWCSDWLYKYRNEQRTNPYNNTASSYRVFRGGSWYNYARRLRVSDRGFFVPSNTSYSLGFRITRTVH